MTCTVHSLACSTSASSCSDKVHKGDLWHGSQLWAETCQTGRRSVRGRGKSFQLCAKQAKANGMCGWRETGWRQTRRPASCEGLQATRRHERFLTEQRSDSWPWKKVTPARVWRINWKGERLATSWLIEAVAQDRDLFKLWPGLLTRTKQARQQCKNKATQETWLYTCVSTTNYIYRTQITDEGWGILHSLYSTSLRRPTGQGAVWGSSAPESVHTPCRLLRAPHSGLASMRSKGTRETPSPAEPWPRRFLCTAYGCFDSKAK